MDSPESVHHNMDQSIPSQEKGEHQKSIYSERVPGDRDACSHLRGCITEELEAKSLWTTPQLPGMQTVLQARHCHPEDRGRRLHITANR